MTIVARDKKTNMTMAVITDVDLIKAEDEFPWGLTMYGEVKRHSAGDALPQDYLEKRQYKVVGGFNFALANYEIIP